MWEQLSLFDISIITADKILQKIIKNKTTLVSGGASRVVQQFRKGESMSNNVAFLKKEYGTGGFNGWDDNCSYFVDFSPNKGILITVTPKYAERTQKRYSWQKIAEMYDSQIKAEMAGG